MANVLETDRVHLAVYRESNIYQLPLREVEGVRDVGEALAVDTVHGAGQRDLANTLTWLNSRRNMNTDIANMWKNAVSFFPGTVRNGLVSYVAWNGSNFYDHKAPLSTQWNPGRYRVVLVA